MLTVSPIRDRSAVHISIAVFAWNEEHAIRPALSSVLAQSLLGARAERDGLDVAGDDMDEGIASYMNDGGMDLAGARRCFTGRRRCSNTDDDEQ